MHVTIVSRVLPTRAVVCPTCEADIGRPCVNTRGKHRGERMHGAHRTRLPGTRSKALPPAELAKLHARMLLAARVYTLVKTRGELDGTIRDLERNAARWAIGLGRAGRAAVAR